MTLKFPFVIAAVLVAVNVSAQAPPDRHYDAPPPRFDAPQQQRFEAPPQENTKFAWADVLRVDPVYDRAQANAPREECDDVPVDRRVDGGNNNAAGTVIGAIVGGVLGNTVG